MKNLEEIILSCSVLLRYFYWAMRHRPGHGEVCTYRFLLIQGPKQFQSEFFFSLRTSISFLDSSVGKESACNAGDPGSIPGSGRSPGEGTGYPLQYPWASLVAQLVKNPPAKQETWVQSLGCEDPLEEGKTTHSSILAWRTVHGVAKS